MVVYQIYSKEELKAMLKARDVVIFYITKWPITTHETDLFMVALSEKYPKACFLKADHAFAQHFCADRFILTVPHYIIYKHQLICGDFEPDKEGWLEDEIVTTLVEVESEVDLELGA